MVTKIQIEIDGVKEERYAIVLGRCEKLDHVESLRNAVAETLSSCLASKETKDITSSYSLYLMLDLMCKLEATDYPHIPVGHLEWDSFDKE